MYPNQPLGPYYDANAPKVRKKRGAALSGFLIFNALGNMGIAGGSVYIAMEAAHDPLLLLDPDAMKRTQQMAVVAAAAAFLNLVAILGVWTFKRWGIALSLAVSLLGVGLAWRLDFTPNLIGSAVSVALLLLLTLPRLSQFE